MIPFCLESLGGSLPNVIDLDLNDTLDGGRTKLGTAIGFKHL